MHLASVRLACAAAAAVVLFGARSAFPQARFQAVGPNECLNCHDHDDERQWYEKKEIPEVQRLYPDKKDNAGHINSLKQLEAPKSKDFAAAIGLADKYDLHGACVQCHATVFAGDANAGVSCESCHGPASGYLKPHQVKGTYEESVAQYGMTRLVGNIQGWTQQCTNCHVMNDDRLIKAGHPAGDDFDLGKRFLPVSLHFKKKYDAAQVAGIAGPEMAGIIRRRRPNAAPPAPEPPAPPAAPAAPEPPRPAAEPPGATPPAPVSPQPDASQIARSVARPRAPSPSRDVPPPGSPTSIEPPAPLPAAAAPASATAPARAPDGTGAPIAQPPATDRLTALLPWLAVAVAGLAVGLGFFFYARSRSR